MAIAQSFSDPMTQTVTILQSADVDLAGTAATAITTLVAATDPLGDRAYALGLTAPLGVKSYNPATQVNYPITSTTPVDLDATNLATPITAPASGNVKVTLNGLTAVSANTQTNWQVRDDTNNAVLQNQYMTFTSSSLSGNFRLTAVFYITGLTPGAAYTLAWAASRPSGTGSANISAGGAAGPATMLVERL